MLMSVCTAYAQYYYSGKVGETISLPKPSIPAGYNGILDLDYSSSSEHLSVYSGTSSVKILSYFEGTEIVTCNYTCYREVYSSGRLNYYYGTFSTNYYIKCTSPAPGLVLSASPGNGQVGVGTSVKLSVTYNGSNISGCDIYYTLNGSTPNKNSIPYNSGVTIDSDCTLKAIAYKTGYEPSEVLTEKYTVVDITLTADPAGGNVSKGTIVHLYSNRPNASIRYTLDGSTPTLGDPIYKESEGIVINQSCTLKATAKVNGANNSIISTPVMEWKFTVSSPKLSLTATPSGGRISKGSIVKLTAKAAGTAVNADIYYTLDGTTPTKSSTKYTSSGITLNSDCTLKAIAIRVGYENSDVLSQKYYITKVDVVHKFPDANTKMFEYGDVNPYIKFNNDIEASSKINNVELRKEGKEPVDGNIIVADSTIFFIPTLPLDLGCYYHMSIPADAIKTQQGETNDATSWSFTTGNYVTGIAMGGPELAMATKTDGTLQTWGMLYKSGKSTDGSYTMTQQLTPTSFMENDFRSASSGYMHHAIIKNDGSLWMWGRQYCGEFGNNSTTGSANPVKVMEEVLSVSCGGQTTAIIKNDGSLWMCGRNDFGQIGDSTVVNRLVPVSIMSEVVSAVAGWCCSFAIKVDGSLWAWGRNDKNLLGNGEAIDSWIPVKVMEDVAIVAASATESQWVAAVKTDGSLWIWGATQPLPTKVLDEVCSVAVGSDYVEAVKKDGSLWAFGDNRYGQLGNGTTTFSSTPIKILDGVAQVTSGGQITMVNMQNGSVLTWGRNYAGTLGNGSSPSLTAHTISPVEIIEGRTSSTLTGIISRKSTYKIVEGTTNVIDALPVPMNAAYNELSWSSRNSDVVNVSNRGVIRAEAVGETEVVATIKNDKGTEYSLVCHVIVTDTDIDDVRLANVSRITVWANNHLLHIEGLHIGQHINIYATNGTTVYQRVADNTAISIPIALPGVYVVRTDGYSAKVLVK